MEIAFAIAQSAPKRTSPARIECRACFFLIDAFLYLCQGLTIAVAEAAGKYGNNVDNSSDKAKTRG